ncbi:hypothetical protein D4R75_00735 [bacterium]|nr:MAG: hypothetical protein D4R75_00735 [bacterium]
MHSRLTFWNRIGGQVDLPARTRVGLGFWTASSKFATNPEVVNRYGFFFLGWLRWQKKSPSSVKPVGILLMAGWGCALTITA